MFHRRPAPQRQSSTSGVIPAPVRGLNKRDSLSAMKPDDAIILDNYIPEASYVRLRRGYVDHASGITGTVQTLAPWSGPATSKLKAAIADKIYDVTSAGAVGAAEVSSLTNGRWQHTQFTNSAGSFLVMCNGADDTRTYDGTSWTSPTITGVASTLFVNVCSHKSRLWFVEKDTMNAWYLAVDAISGAATKFPLGSVFNLGGKLKLVGTLSRDAGDGADDFLVFVSSLGEVAVYQGADPSSASTWALVGVYQTGAPVSDRALIKLGGDLGIVCSDGVTTVNAIMSMDRSRAREAALTDRIRDGFSDAYRDYASNYGWQAINYPAAHLAIFNIPTSTTEAFQYAMNTQTGAWCSFGLYASPMDAICWGVLGDTLYFGGVNGVWKADYGTDDDDTDITGQMKTAFNYLGTTAAKAANIVRFTVRTNALPRLQVRVNVDYDNDNPTTDDIFILSSDITEGMVWDEDNWDEANWAGSDETYSFPLGVHGIGRALALNLKTATQGVSLEINAMDLFYERQQAMAL